MIYKLINDGVYFIDDAKCFGCGESQAETEFLVDDRHVGYVCDTCLAAIHKGGAAEWKQSLLRDAKWHRAKAARAEKRAGGINTAAEVKISLAVLRDIGGDFTILGYVERDDDDGLPPVGKVWDNQPEPE